MIRFSKHAEQRSQQRGAPLHLIQLILENADIEKHIGDNCTLIRVSSRRAKYLRLSDKLSSFGIVWSDTNAQIVTVLPLHRGSSGRRYRTKH